MTRRDLVLAAMAPANGGRFTPVQIQKLFFLIDQNVAGHVDGPHFSFGPYHYGPFDKAVYHEIDGLVSQGLAEHVQDRRWTSYRLTELGQLRGEQIARELAPQAQDYIKRAVDFVRRLSFTDLVSAIYRAYP